MSEFNAFPKIARLNREMVITEKIDGTNAQVEIFLEGTIPANTPVTAIAGDFIICAGSRNRYITPQNDNQGFARWVAEHHQELAQLGPGRHYGEWWGHGIQRTYGLTEKRFSLFNVARWMDSPPPACCHVVPTLYRGPFDTAEIKYQLDNLGFYGSVVAPGWMRPEGIVIFHTHSNSLFKVTLEDDAKGKGQ